MNEFATCLFCLTLSGSSPEGEAPGEVAPWPTPTAPTQEESINAVPSPVPSPSPAPYDWEEEIAQDWKDGGHDPAHLGL